MKQILALVLLFTSISFSQTDFWSHYSLNVPVSKLSNYGDSLFLAVSNYDILRSTNKGLDWDAIFTSEDTCQGWSQIYLCERQVNSNDVYLIVNQVNGSSGCIQPSVFISTNTGQNWQELNLPGQSFIDIDIMNNGDLVYLNLDTTYYSEDLGTTWNYLYIPYGGKVKQIEVNTNDWIYLTKHFQYFDEWTWTLFDYEVLYCSSDNGQNWNSIASTSQWPMERFYNLFHTNYGETLAIEGHWNNKVFYDNMIIRESFPLENVTSAVTIDTRYFLPSIGINGPNLYYSQNSGQTWTFKNEGLTNLNDFNTIIKDKFGYLYLGTDQGIFKSNFSQFPMFQANTKSFNDTKIGDTTYKQIYLTNPLTNNLSIDSLLIQNQEYFIVGSIDSVLESGSNDSIFVGFSPSQFGQLSSKLTIYTDIIIDEIALLGTSPIPTLVSVPFNNNFGDVQIGDTASLAIDLTTQSINTIRIDSIYLQTGQYFFVNQLEYPLYLNENDTINLSILFIPLIQSVLPKQDNIIVQSNAENNPLSLLVKGRGVNPNFVEVEGPINSFDLSECYPNPFNPTTTIEYQVPKTSNVKISVFNLVGEEIAVLVNEEKSQGKYKVEFNGANLSSGVYFYRMQAENFTSTKKFVLLK